MAATDDDIMMSEVPTASHINSSQPIARSTSAPSDLFNVDKKREGTKMKAAEQRMSIRNYIRNERDTVQRKWLSLQESVNSEERRKEQFLKVQEMNKARQLPVVVSKLIKTLKQAVRKEIRDKGGNAYSIIRSMFIYWDADKTNMLSHNELRRCLHSMGVKVSDADLHNIIDYYDVGKRYNELEYKKLLDDIQFGEPSMFEFVDPEKEKDFDSEEILEKSEIRYLEGMPSIVSEFVEAIKIALAKKIRNEGGTALSHIRDAFLRFDRNYRNALSANQLILSMKTTLKIQVSRPQAGVIVDYYRTGNEPEMSYEKLVKDVMVGAPAILEHEEISRESIEKAYHRELNNTFVSQKYVLEKNKVVESFKQRIVSALTIKLRYQGGSLRERIFNAFKDYDDSLSGCINSIDKLRLCVRKFGFTISEDEAQVIFRTFDKNKVGQMDYKLLTDETCTNDASAFQNSAEFLNPPATARTPLEIMSGIQKIKMAADKFVEKSRGSITSRDLLHGTFVRFDARHLGRVNFREFNQVLNELRVVMDDSQKGKLVTWFSTDGTISLDYNSLVKQLYGDDVTTRTFALPTIQKVFNTQVGFSETFNKSLAPTLTSRGTHSLDVKETVQDLKKKKKDRLKIILAEKIRIEKKLNAIDQQEKQLLERKKIDRGIRRV